MNKEVVKNIVYSQVTCLECGEVLVSEHRHDYKTCSCPNETMIDGGNAYVRYGGKDLSKVETFTVFDTDDFCIIREYFGRINKGIDGSKPPIFVKLKDIDDSWLKNIIMYEQAYRPNNKMLDLYKREIYYRKYFNIIGEVYKNKYGESYKIIEVFNKKNCVVKFEDGTVIKGREYGEIKLGSIKNPNTRILNGNCYKGFGKYKSSINSIKTKDYQTWVSMIKRTSNTNNVKNKTYKDVVLCEEWFNFQNFAKWFEENYVEGFELDKDILSGSNKIYSPETCCFVPKEINMLLRKGYSKKTSYPIGVHKIRNKFVARLSTNKNRVSLGVFNTLEEASLAYKSAKELRVKELAIKYKEKISPSCYNKLINYKEE